jgi:hypothetical protein
MSFEINPALDLKDAKSVMLGERQVMVLPLTLRQTIKVADTLKKVSQPDAATADHIDALIDFALIGLGRTYPQLTRDDVLDSEATVPQLRAVVDVLIDKLRERT